MTNSANVPAIALRTGGAVATVFSEQELQARLDGRYPLEFPEKMTIIRIVQEQPELNNDASLDLLVDIFSWHGIDSKTNIRGLVRDFGVEQVHFALEFLFACGKHGHRIEQVTKKYQPMEHVRPLLEFLQELDACETSFELSIETLDNLVRDLGGLYRALDLSKDQIDDTLRNAVIEDPDIEEEDVDDAPKVRLRDHYDDVEREADYFANRDSHKKETEATK